MLTYDFGFMSQIKVGIFESLVLKAKIDGDIAGFVLLQNNLILNVLWEQ